MEGYILYECCRCLGAGYVFEGPRGSKIACEACKGSGKNYVELDFAKEQLEAMKEDLFYLLEKILKLEKDIQDVESN